MCTLLLATRHFDGVPLVVAANRDERLARPAVPPEALEHGGMQIFAPRDLKAGGTWLGLNRAGVFVGLTNRFGAGPMAEPARRSRGQLVLDALSAPDAAAATRWAAGEPAERYNMFHLLAADRSGAWLAWHDGMGIHRRELAPGVHVVTERSLDAADDARGRWLEAQAAELDRSRAPSPSELRVLLSQHGDEPFERTCVHFPKMGYGTRASTLVYLDPSAARVLHAEGPPCTTDYEEITERAGSALH